MRKNRIKHLLILLAIPFIVYLAGMGMIAGKGVSVHLPRCQLAFESEGVEKVGTAHADYRKWREIYSLLRGSAGLSVYRLKLK